MTASKNDMFKQCKLTRGFDGGYKEDVAWIPEKFAVRGKVLKIGNQLDLWVVAEVWGTRSYEWLLANEREYKALTSIQGRGAISYD